MVSAAARSRGSPQRGVIRLTLGAGDAGGVASSSFGAAEVGAVVQAVGQGHLGTGAAHAAHHHGVGTHLSRPIPRLLRGRHEPMSARPPSLTELNFMKATTRGRTLTTEQQRSCDCSRSWNILMSTGAARWSLNNVPI